ncbi:MAG: hypothetical protein GY754_19105 [bacterium]|nr:hypothetical protein [bacterium]
MRKLLTVTLFLMSFMILSCKSHEREVVLPKGCTSPDRLLIFHTGDHHASFFEKKSRKGTAGGLARQMSFIEKEKAKALKLTKCPAFLTVSAGDILSGDVVSDNLVGEPDIRAMSTIGYTGMALGNHEFDRKFDSFLNVVKKHANFSILSSNFVYKEKKKNQYPVDRYVVLTIGDYRVGLIGVTTENAAKDDLLREDKKRYDFSYGLDAVNEVLETLKDKVDAVGVLAHLGSPLKAGNKTKTTSFDILTKTNGAVDFIIDGHDHKTTKKPIIKNNTALVKAGKNSLYVGKLVYDVSGRKKLKFSSYELVEMTSHIPKHAKILKLEEEYIKSAGDYFKVVFKNSPIYFNGNRSTTSTQKTNLSQFFTDAYRFCGDGADVAFIHANNMRNDILPGDVTVRDLMNTCPFIFNKLRIKKAAVKGDRLLEFIKALRIYRFERNRLKARNEMVHNSGMTIKSRFADMKSIDDIRKIDKKEIAINGAPLDLNKSYKIITNHYIIHNCVYAFTDFKFTGKELSNLKNKKTLNDKTDWYPGWYNTRDCLVDYALSISKKEFLSKYSESRFLPAVKK